MQNKHLFSSINFLRRSLAELIFRHSSPQWFFFPQNIQGYIGERLPPSILFLCFSFLFFTSTLARVLFNSFSLFLFKFFGSLLFPLFSGIFP
ncbi:unnamed protein product [Meloidogyne enterolobii]|uniref:Uncharacterized protein n=1 Tax=Meloidogyne enterolobii TaxID=390850 RepID=A0ACB1A377_MELEN